MARREPRQERGEATRKALLDAAMDLVAERGMGGISHRAVAARAGVSAGMTSYFFASIDELLQAAISERYSRRIATFKAAAEELAVSDSSMVDMARLAGELFWAPTEAQLLAHLEVCVNAARQPELRALLEPVFESMTDLACASANVFGIEEEERFARAVIALVQGIQLSRAAQGQDLRGPLAEALQLLAVGALAMEEDPEGWTQRLLASRG